MYHIASPAGVVRRLDCSHACCSTVHSSHPTTMPTASCGETADCVAPLTMNDHHWLIVQHVLQEARLPLARVPSPEEVLSPKKNAAAPLAVVKTTSDWDRIDHKLLAAVQAGEKLPSVEVQAPLLHAPGWAKHVSRSMQDADDTVRAEDDKLKFAKTEAGARSMAQMLPGCTSLPAFTPVQGTEVSSPLKCIVHHQTNRIQTPQVKEKPELYTRTVPDTSLSYLGLCKQPVNICSFTLAGSRCCYSNRMYARTGTGNACASRISVLASKTCSCPMNHQS